ncbi:hypothetical protein FRC07_011576, partial [Ceratobasidium sp. 392]
ALTSALIFLIIARIAPEELPSRDELDAMFGLPPGSPTTSQNDSEATHKRKRVRIGKDEKQTTVIRNKLSLNQLLGVPPEVFSEIACHLTPPDLLALARSNKLFRAIFMSPPSLSIRYVGAMIHLVDLLEVLFGENAVLECYERWTRDCVLSCAQDVEILLAISEEDWQFNLLPTSSDIIPKWPGSNWCLKRDLQTLHQHPDETSLEAWKTDRRKELEQRYEHAAYLDDFLDDMEWDRAHEIQELKEARKLDIEERLDEDGWTPDDMDFPDETRPQWNQLVLQPKPLTDRRISTPKLIPLLEANRTRHRQIAEYSRLEERRALIHECMTVVLNVYPPLAEVAVYWTDNPNDEPVVTKLNVPFPTTIEVFKWLVIPELVRANGSLEELRAEFFKRE